VRIFIGYPLNSSRYEPSRGADAQTSASAQSKWSRRVSERFGREEERRLPRPGILYGVIEKPSIMPCPTHGCSAYPFLLGFFVEPSRTFGILKHSLERSPLEESPIKTLDQLRLNPSVSLMRLSSSDFF
jgi:hypothetical protein